MPDARNGRSVRLLHLTDPHLFADASGALRGVVTHDSLRSVLDHYRESDWEADRVIVTGDIIQDDSAEAYTRFRDLLLPLNLRVHCVPGNHDTPELMRMVCSFPPFSYLASEKVGDWMLIGVDSCLGGRAGGAVSDAEMQRLSDAVSQTAASHIMVYLHHPPIKMGSAWLDTVGMTNADDFLQLLQSLDKIRITAFGHVHQDYDEVHDGIRIIATPSTCRQFMPGSDEFAVDDRPPAYRRITLYDNGGSDSELIWLDDA